jgi:hypothetical protein
MKRVAISLALLLLASSAVADQNPELRIHLDFAPPESITVIYPEEGTVFDVYIVADCFGEDGGLRGMALAVERTFEAYSVDQTNLLHGFEYGNVEDPYGGWHVAGGPDTCYYPDENGIVLVGYIRYHYAGGAGHVKIIPCEIMPWEALDCNHFYDFWCASGHAGVHGPAPDPDPWCQCPRPVPVADKSWGVIKGLYR